VDSATDLVTISIGGNDARFTKVGKACLWKSDCRNTGAAGVSGVTWAEFLPTHINTTVKQAVKAVYQEIRTAAPNAAVVALGYPLLVSGIECSDLNIVQDRGFSAEEQAFVRQMADLLNEVMEDAAREAGVHFLEEVATKFSPHEICDVGANPWLHGVLLKPSVHSLHPNQAGQAAYAAVVNEFLNRTGIDYANGFFASGLPRNPPPQF
jgi:lysophospholipase L1-like esterase